MAVPTLLYEIKSWTITKNDERKIKFSERKYLLSVKGYSKMDKMRNNYIRKKLVVNPKSDKTENYRRKRKDRF